LLGRNSRSLQVGSLLREAPELLLLTALAALHLGQELTAQSVERSLRCAEAAAHADEGCLRRACCSLLLLEP
jgi:hypothetical protein